MRKILAIVASVAFAVFTNQAWAADAASGPDSEINPWLDCGIGAMIFPNTPTAAAISNIIWDLGTTAVSSDLSSKEACKGKRTKSAMFINQTYPELAAETAVGRGEHLVALADILQCQDSARPQLVADIRTGMANNLAQPGFSELTRVQKAEKYFDVVDTTVKSRFARQCRGT